jgi:hypothetical protein
MERKIAILIEKFIQRLTFDIQSTHFFPAFQTYSYVEIIVVICLLLKFEFRYDLRVFVEFMYY